MQKFINELFEKAKCCEATKIRVTNVLNGLYRMSQEGLGYNEHFYPPIPCSGISWNIGKRAVAYLRKNVNHLVLEDYLVSLCGRKLKINFFWFDETIAIDDVERQQESKERHAMAKEVFKMIDKTNIKHVKTACKILNAMVDQDPHVMIASLNEIEEWSSIPRDLGVLRDSFGEFGSWNGDLCRQYGWRPIW